MLRSTRRRALEEDDVDLALDGLTPSHEPPPAPAPAVTDKVDGEEHTERSGHVPPPTRRAIDPKAYKARTRFDDLFASDTKGSAVLRGSLDEKIDYFREKLRTAEGQIARFRQAWDVRESEMDAIESLLDEARTRADTTAHKLEAIEAQWGERKTQVDAYGKKVTEAFAEQERTEKTLRDELAQLREAADAATAEHHLEQQGLRDTLAERDRQLEALVSDVADAHQEIDRHRQRVRELEAQLAQQTADGAQHHEEQEDAALKLKMALQSVRNNVSHLETELAEARREIESRSQEAASRDESVTQVRAEMAALQQEIVQLQSDCEMRDAAILDLKRVVQRLKQTGTELEQSLRDAAAQTQAEAARSAQAQQQVEAARAELMEHSAEAANLRRMVDALRQKATGNQDDLANVHDALAARDATIAKLNAALDQARAALANAGPSKEATDYLAKLQKVVTVAGTLSADLTRELGPVLRSVATDRRDEIEAIAARLQKSVALATQLAAALDWGGKSRG